MTCYGVDTTRITTMSDALREFDVDMLDFGPDKFAAYARENSQQLRKLAELYLDMAECFFEVMREVSAETLSLEREASAQPSEPRVDRAYLDGFLPIYDRASKRAFRHLRQLLMREFANAPELQAGFVTQIVASETVAEADQFTSTVPTAKSPVEAQQHGKAGKEIVDSVKGFLKEYLNKFVSDKNFMHKLARRVAHVDITKAGIEQSLHVVNEVLGMVFPGLA